MKPANLYIRPLLATILLLTTLSGFTQDKVSIGASRQVINLNDQWTFLSDSVARSAPAGSKPSWQKVTLPHTWNTTDVLDDIPGYYRGTGIYKRDLIVPEFFTGQQAALSFNGVGQQCEVFVNGRSAGKHIGGYNRFIIPITKFIAKGNNTLEVRATNKYDADVPPLTGDFTQFGGIYRSVDLVITNPVHFSQSDFGASGVYVSTPAVSATSATVQVRAILVNSSATARRVKLVISIRNAENKTIASKTSDYKLAAGETRSVINTSQPVANPKLWSPANPYLYKVITEIRDENMQPIDCIITSAGFRWFKFDAETGFSLNDKPLKLIGASRHQDYANMGNAVPEVLQVRDVELLKEMGGNFLRVAHYPQDQSVLDACDRLGILTSIETPVVNTITVSDAFTANAVNMQKEMIRQNFNHPSIVLWAYMNEVLLQPRYIGDTTKQRSYLNAIKALAQKLEDLTRAEDPSRYTMMANHGAFDAYNKLGLTRIPMVVGWNLYSGWYSGTLPDFGKFLDRHRKELPDKPMLVTEYGADADPRIRTSEPVKFDKSIEYAMKYHQSYLNDIFSRPFVAGAMAWNLADFNSEFRSETMPHINNKGLLTISREPKDTYWLYKATLTQEPLVKIGSSGWAFRGGVEDSSSTGTSTQEIQVITNSNSVSLTHNGKPIGNAAVTDHVAVFKVPFVNGANHLVALAANGATDAMDINFNLVPDRFSTRSFTMNVLVGANRYYFDRATKEVWVPDREYQPGRWGHIGGNAVKISGTLPPYGSSKNINGTENDPVYQTQQEGLTGYQLDVPDGEYLLTLHFAELTGGSVRKVVNDLNTGTVAADKVEQRIFNVDINAVRVLDKFNISEEYDAVTAVQKQFRLTVANGKGINIKFGAVAGKPVLNALQLKKIQ